VGRPLRRIAAVLVAAVALAGCGEDAAPPEDFASGQILGDELRLADCSDWSGASSAERLEAVSEIRDFAGGPVGSGGGRGAILDDEAAYDLFEGWCEQEFARAFRLYKLYTRAAAFTGH
jgi:hypothetical protein